MPVTIRLSSNFYERLGDDATNELIDWFNAVDATYRADLRDLNELNFACFDAKLEQRVTEVHAKLDAKIESVAARLDAKIDGVAERLEARIKHGLETLGVRMNERLATFESKLERRLGEQTRWLFVAWASLLLPIIGLWMRR